MDGGGGAGGANTALGPLDSGRLQLTTAWRAINRFVEVDEEVAKKREEWQLSQRQLENCRILLQQQVDANFQFSSTQGPPR